VDLPANRVARPEEIKGQIAQLDIEPGTVITSSMFQSDAALTNSVSTALKPGMVAVTISSDQTKSVAGLITQGDYVNLTLVGDCTMGSDGKLQVTSGGAAVTDTSGGATGAAALTIPCAAPIYQKVRILGIGRSLGTGVSTPVATPGEAAPPTTVAPTSDLITFEVPPEAAQVISSVNGNIYMTLVRKDYVPHEIPITPYAVSPTPGALTPYGGDPEAQTAGN
jgi:Flp pilus assembly protein CpaB